MAMHKARQQHGLRNTGIMTQGRFNEWILSRLAPHRLSLHFAKRIYNGADRTSHKLHCTILELRWFLR